MRAEAGLVVGVLFGQKNEVSFVESFLISAEHLFPIIVAGVVGGDGGFDGSVFFLGDDFSNLEVGVARF